MDNHPDHGHAARVSAGELVAAPADLAGDAGWFVPIALTRAAHEDCVAWTDADTIRTGAIQDEGGRVYDVLYMAARAFRHKTPNRAGQVWFRVCRIGRDATLGPEGDIEPEEILLILTRQDGDVPHVVISLPTES